MRTVTLLALGVLAVLLGGIVYISLATRIPYPLPVANITVTLPLSPPYRQLTTGSFNDRWPAWSPDGKYIAFISDRGGLWSLWVMDANGTSLRRLSPAGAIAMNPAWSPDSSMIAYWSFKGSAASIKVVRPSDGSTVDLTGPSLVPVMETPSWSPDGSRLAFWLQDGALHLALADVKTSAVTVLAEAVANSPSATWLNASCLLYNDNSTGVYVINWLDVDTGSKGVFMSGDGSFVTPAANVNGTWVAFYSDIIPEITGTLLSSGFGGYEIYVCQGDGGNLTFQYVMSPGQYQSHDLVPMPLIPGVIDWSAAPAWSGDGRKVLYIASDPLNGNDLFMWDVANWTTAMLPPLEGNEQDPSWSPDNVNAAFSCDLGGFYHIWVINTAGSGMARAGSGY